MLAMFNEWIVGQRFEKFVFALFACLGTPSMTTASDSKLSVGTSHLVLELLRELKEVYQKSDDNTDMPPQVKGPIKISIQIYYINLDDVDASRMDFRADFFLHHTWKVPNDICGTYRSALQRANVSVRSGQAIIVPPGHISLFWLPDTYVTTAKLVDTPFKNGPSRTLKMEIASSDQHCTMHYTLRQMSRIGCPMHFGNYPVDEQKCSFPMRSFSYPVESLVYEWDDQSSSLTVDPSIGLLQFRFSMRQGTRNITMLNATYSELYVNMTFRRDIAHHLIQVYCPSLLIVALSWFSFWMGLDAIPGRITLVVTSFLALVTMFSGSRRDLPPVSYTNLMDVWIITCMLFVFASLMEFSFIKLLDTRHKRKQQKKGDRHQYAWEMVRIASKSRRDWVHDTDVISSVAFPCLFLLFIAIYWPILINRSYW